MRNKLTEEQEDKQDDFLFLLLDISLTGLVLMLLFTLIRVFFKLS